MTMQVMTLEWSKVSKPNDFCPYDHVRAKTPFGFYMVTWKSWKDFPSFAVDYNGDQFTTENDLELAKEAAEKDFGKRIAEATSSTASPP